MLWSTVEQSRAYRKRKTAVDPRFPRRRGCDGHRRVTRASPARRRHVTTSLPSFLSPECRPDHRWTAASAVLARTMDATAMSTMMVLVISSRPRLVSRRRPGPPAFPCPPSAGCSGRAAARLADPRGVAVRWPSRLAGARRPRARWPSLLAATRRGPWSRRPGLPLPSFETVPPPRITGTDSNTG